jgi:hypothetical protein
MARTALSIPCPDCNNKLRRISYWDNKNNKITNSNEWFICLECNATHQITYSFKPRVTTKKGVKNAKSI